jgi:hypothetical protein
MEAAWKLGSQQPHSTIVLTGTSRSGTTWLLELLASAARVRWIWEPWLPPPLHQGDTGETLNWGLGMYPYLDLDEEHPDLKDFFSRLLSGQTSCRMPPLEGISRPDMLRRLLFPQLTVAKFARAQRIVGWFQRRFAARTLLIIRHPVTTVGSQLSFDAYHHTNILSEHPAVSERLRRDWPDLVRYATALPHLEQRLAATWAFDCLLALKTWQKSQNSLVITYEGLVTRPDIELPRLTRIMGYRVDVGRLSKPSTTSTRSYASQSERLRLDKQLTRPAIERILEVVKEFGIEVYARDQLPDFSILDNLVEDGSVPQRSA